MQVLVKSPSKWQFATSSTGGLGVEFFAVEGGAIYLKDPAGKKETFRYGSAGAGLTWGLKLPKIGKLELKSRGKSVGGAVAPAGLPNAGTVYVMDSFKGDDFSRSDITGACVFVELYGGMIAGYSGTAMLFGINPTWLSAVLLGGPLASAPALLPLIHSARGLLLMRGLNVGAVAGAGVGAFVGCMF
ncbi:MAG TPA: hypothetical protein VGP07_11420 [Polyangia bacterium]|jgi:hypothetical protein